MKTILSLLLIFLFSTGGFSQKAIKINTHFQYTSYDYSHTRNESLSKIDTEISVDVLPSLTFNIYTPKGNFHEIGISRLQFGVEDIEYSFIDNDPSDPSFITGAKTNSFKIEFRYDYNIKLSKKNKSITPFLGLTTAIRYEFKNYDPKISTVFSKRTDKIDNSIGIVPRIIWNISKSVFIDLNTPLNIFQVEYKHQRIFNPSLPIEQQKNGGFETTFLPKNYEVRLGVGILLSKE